MSSQLAQQIEETKRAIVAQLIRHSSSSPSAVKRERIDPAVATNEEEDGRSRPVLGIICGSGLSGLADLLRDPVAVDYADIPNFTRTTVAGHVGKLVFGYLHDKAAVCMLGRFHQYEGHSAQAVTFPVRVMKALGVRALIVTNAAGGLNAAYRAGDIMILKDHISLPGMMGQNPLVGPNDDTLGARFPSMSLPYDPEFRQLAHETAAETKTLTVHSGIYAHVFGPAYESRAESRFLRSIGGDAVGMSSIPEVVVARHSGMRVLGISLITNVVALSEDASVDSGPTHAEVLATSQRSAAELQNFVALIVSRMKI